VLTRKGKNLKDLTLAELDKNLMEEINSNTRPNLDLMALIKQNI